MSEVSMQMQRQPTTLGRPLPGLIGWLGLALGLGLAWVSIVGTALADAEEQADVKARRVQSLSRSIMSPFCPGKTVAACPSPSAQVWREDIRRWVAEGASNEVIEQRLAARVPGFDLRGRPGGAWSWGVPLFGVALASLWLAFMWRRARGRRVREPGSEPIEIAPQSSEGSEPARLDHKLREELEAFDG